VQACVSDQGRHPGDARRRSHGGRLNHEISRLLLVRLREIGDVVFTTPAIRALRRHFPNARLTYIVEPHAAPIVATNPHLDEVLIAPRARGLKGLTADVALGRSLRARRFDLAIDFHGGPRASLLTWLSGARERIGYEIAGRQWMYTRRVARPRALRARHSVENQWDLLAALGIAPPDRTADATEMRVDPTAAATVAARLATAGIGNGHRLAVLHVSAGNPFRRWPLDHFVAVTRSLAADTDGRVVVTAGPSERDLVDRVVAGARAGLLPDAHARVLAWAELPLPELRALLDRAAVYIGGDSGPLHVASTSTVAIVGLYGPTMPARSAPWRDPSFRTVSLDAGELPCRPCDQRVCAPGDFRCLTRIPPDRVVEAAIRCLDA
jgi:ADP-heptose:LPS heptosyltransferase